MDQGNTTRLKITLGSLDLEFEGSEAYLSTELLKLVQAFYGLQRSTLSVSASILENAVQDAQGVQSALDDSVAELRNAVDSLSELSETESLRLQMAMDRESKMMETLSNILKKISDTADSITQNLK